VLDRRYTAEEAKQIIAAATGQWKTLYWLAAETGVRPGELCAFCVQDLDLDRGIIQVQRNVWRDTFQTPKTANAIRAIVLSDALTEHLREFLRTWRPNPLNLLFVSTTAGPLHRCSVRRDQLGPICKALGIKAKGLKAFRHCSASLMDRAGVPMKVRQERLGHAPGTKVTMVHYTHTVSDDARLAATAVGNLLM
jgi:integrase